MASTYDLIVVGGGIVGCGIAERLRSELPSICLIEQGPELGRGASSAALGGINPHLGDHCMGPLGLMAQHSRDLFPDWMERIATAADMPIPVLPTGLLQVAANEKELDRLCAEVMPVLTERGLDVELLDAGRVLAMEPMLGPGVVGGLFQPADLAVEPPQIMTALARILTGPTGPDLLLNATVIDVTAGPDAVTVTLADGRSLDADRVVIAAGHLSHTLLDLPGDALFPIKGQALEFAPRPGHVLSVQCDAMVVDDAGENVIFALPRPDGRIAAGVTFEVGVADTMPTAEARRTILDHLSLVFADLATAPISRIWAGIRPGTRDAAPVLGFVDPDERILAATGHYGMGITLAPVTIDLAAKLLLSLPTTRADQRDLHLTRPRRFELEYQDVRRAVFNAS